MTCVHSENGRLVVNNTADRSAHSAITWNKNSGAEIGSLGTATQARRWRHGADPTLRTTATCQCSENGRADQVAGEAIGRSVAGVVLARASCLGKDRSARICKTQAASLASLVRV
jgi:hypothetical protein